MNRRWSFAFLLLAAPALRAAFEPLGYGAAAKGMGGAYVASAEDGTAAYWNPAGLALVRQPQLTASMEDLYGLGLLRYAAVGYTHPRLGGGTLSAHLLHLDTTGEADFYKYAESTYLVAYGKSLCQDCLSVGAGLRYYAAQGGGARGSGVGLDLGLLWRPFDDRLRLSAAWQDANQPSIRWDTGAEDLQPYTVRTGALFRLTTTTDLAAEWDKRRFEKAQWRFGGAQRLMKNLVTFRGGLHRGGDQEQWGFSVGGGFHFRTFDVDYAWDSQEALGNTQTMSLGLRFGQ
ncbi:MAG TPA: hypothetical protein PKB12_00995 [Elusimicrobiota bacterium]|jgi:hypothetical protein|nr:hypothetical protein [Elusimicrobiota bacterium]HMX42276.1 hypothetical protein [Elusimicrobiota bacterium]HMX93613.1 hypothetical protein [Elusimicrobiota bacterium]HMZ26707.1 hypothetical protein [Elusimicrobiota bacterium]HNA59430.1 hypothetical protein [Elusimicrobiota bacterium]